MNLISDTVVLFLSNCVGSTATTTFITYNIQLSLEGEVNNGRNIPGREASRYISTALHRP